MTLSDIIVVLAKLALLAPNLKSVSKDRLVFGIGRSADYVLRRFELPGLGIYRRQNGQSVPDRNRCDAVATFA